MKHTTIYQKDTHEVIAYCINGVWVLPSEWDVDTSESEPLLKEDENGNVYYCEGAVAN